MHVPVIVLGHAADIVFSQEQILCKLIKWDIQTVSCDFWADIKRLKYYKHF